MIRVNSNSNSNSASLIELPHAWPVRRRPSRRAGQEDLGYTLNGRSNQWEDVPDPEARVNENEAIRTAFHEVTAAQGGSYVEDGGWLWLEGFGDVSKEYAAIRDDVAVW